MSIEFVINGKPLAKKSVCFKRVGNFTKTYDMQVKERRMIGCQLMNQMASQGILRRLESNICVQMRFHTSIPKSWSKKRSKEVLGKPDGRRPDLDNYIKLYADVMSNLVYDDDNQITELWCEKLYSDNPRVEIKIKEIKGCPYEDAEELSIYTNAWGLHSAIWKARRKIRSRLKYDQCVSEAEEIFLDELTDLLTWEGSDES